MPKIDELKFVPIVDPNAFDLIPKYLFEQIKGREWEVEKFYKWGPIFIRNPLNRIWVLTDIANLIKGVLWITIDPVLELIAVNVFSVDRKYQELNGSLRNKPKNNPSVLLLKAKEQLDKFRIELKEAGGAELKEKILWTTTRPHTFRRFGARKSKRVIMEI